MPVRAGVRICRHARLVTDHTLSLRAAKFFLTGVALVTGGNDRLGQRICHALAKEGVHVAVMYAQSRDEAEGVARDLASRHQINVAAFQCDITDGAARLIAHRRGPLSPR